MSKSGKGGGKRAVGKSKTKKQDKKEDEIQERVYEYFRSQNRPFSVNDVVSNLHNTIGKTAMTKVIDSLVEQELLIKKIYGKQMVFVISQDDMEELSTEEISRLDIEINKLKERQQELNNEIKRQQKQIQQLKNILSDKQLVDEVEVLREENTKMEEKLEKLMKGNYKTVDLKKKEQLDNSTVEINKIYKNRRKCCIEMLGMIGSGMGKTNKEMFVNLELEDDNINPILG